MLIHHFGASFSHETPCYATFPDVLFRGYVKYTEETQIPLQACYSAWRGSARPPNLEPQSLGEVLESPYNSMELVLLVLI
jgi:hypothetical protein